MDATEFEAHGAKGDRTGAKAQSRGLRRRGVLKGAVLLLALVGMPSLGRMIWRGRNKNGWLLRPDDLV